MRNSFILPSVVKLDTVSSDLVKISYVFNRWLNQLNTFGHLDSHSVTEDFNTIQRILKSKRIARKIKKAVASCRDRIISVYSDVPKLSAYLTRTLEMISEHIEDSSIKKIKRRYADQGMTELYRPLLKRLKKIRLHDSEEALYASDVEIIEPRTARKIRRIVEKNAAQTVARHGRNRHSNGFRQAVRRAKSFALYHASEAPGVTRYSSTHWTRKVDPLTGKRTMRRKHAYHTLDEALAAAASYNATHNSTVSPYVCAHCGKYHLGHTNSRKTTLDSVAGSDI